MSGSRARVGEVYATQLHDGRWCACQVVRSDAEQVELLALDWMGDDPPTLDDLENVRGLRVEEAGETVPCRVNAGAVPPWRFRLVGEMEPVETFPRRCATWSGWGFVPYKVHAWWRWNHEVSEEIRAARRQQHRQRGRIIEVSLGGRNHRFDESIWRLWLTPERMEGVAHQVEIDPSEPIDWSALELLPNLSEVQYHGADEGFLDFLRARPFVTRMTWKRHGREQIDLSETWLEAITLEVGSGPLEIALPPVAHVVRLVNFTDPDSPVVIRDHHRGRHLVLRIRGAAIPEHIEGVPELRFLSVWDLEHADASKVLAFPELRFLDLTGAPGVLRGVSWLTRLENLEQLTLCGFRDLESRTFPPADAWPALKSFFAWGLKASDVATIESRLAGVGSVIIREPVDTDREEDI